MQTLSITSLVEPTYFPGLHLGQGKKVKLLRIASTSAVFKQNKVGMVWEFFFFNLKLRNS